MSMRRVVPLTLSASLVLAAGCLVPTSTEQEIGAEEARRIALQMPKLDDEKLNAYVAGITKRLVEHAERKDIVYQIQVVDMAEPNAFALPGGFLYVSRGLLALVNDEAELAGVIGHEIGHVEARHSVRRIGVSAPFSIASGLAGWAVGIVSPALGNVVSGTTNAVTSGLVVAPYARSQEREADSIGLVLAAKAGYAPMGLSNFLDTLGRDAEFETGKPEGFHFLATHPVTASRVAATQEQAASLAPAEGAAAIAPTRQALLARLDGLPLGVNAAGGVFQDELFIQPDLDFAIRFPKGWKTANTAAAVYGGNEEGDAVLSLQIVEAGDDAMATFERVNQENGGQLVATPLEINGFDALRTRVTQGNGSGAQIIEATWIPFGGQIYQVTGIVLANREGVLIPQVRDTAASFAAATHAQRKSVRQLRLRSTAAKSSESPDAIAKRSGTPWKPEKVAIANALTPGQSFEGGFLVKVAKDEPYLR